MGAPGSTPAASGSAAASSPPAPTPDPGPKATGKASRSRMQLYTILGVVVIVLVLVAAAALTDGFKKPSSASGTQVLVPEGTDNGIPPLQFDSVTITVTSGSATINGTIIDSYGLQLYTMNISQFHYLITKGVVGTYDWTSGLLGNVTVFHINLVFGPGTWALVFFNPNSEQSDLSTSVGFYTNLVLIQ
jgi:hypothetical protein